jgi:hypothetical protein
MAKSMKELKEENQSLKRKSEESLRLKSDGKINEGTQGGESILEEKIRGI